MKKIITLNILIFLFVLVCAGQIIETKIIASDGESGDQFGISASIDGEYTIIGANKDDIGTNTNQGSAYIYKYNGMDWIEQAKLFDSVGHEDDEFGISVSINGEYAIIGAVRWRDNVKGKAYIFKLDGNIWIEQSKLTVSDGDSNKAFGYSVDIYGDYAIVGAAKDNHHTGAAYIFKRDSSTWMEQAKLTASDGDNWDHFGTSVALHDTLAIIGAEGDDDNGFASGSAYIFIRIGENWIEHTKIIASDGAPVDIFGRSVSISSNFALVGAPESDALGGASGSAYLFNNMDTTWIEQIKLLGSDTDTLDGFGNAVSINDNYALVGAWGCSNYGIMSGSVYLFKRNHLSWSEELKLFPSDAKDGQVFGSAVDMSGNFIVVGAFGDTTNGESSGALYIYNGNFSTSVLNGFNNIPQKIEVIYSYPNPFNSFTKIEYSLPGLTDVEIVIFNLLGQKVRTLVNETKQEGSHQIIWNGQNNNGEQIPSGMYFCQFKTPEYIEVLKIILLK